jgi:hypothetical protein
MPGMPNGDICPHELTPYLKNFLSPIHFSRLPPPPEPYYNPANLEKAWTRVKQKEFIHSITEAAVAIVAAHQ